MISLLRHRRTYLMLLLSFQPAQQKRYRTVDVGVGFEMKDDVSLHRFRKEELVKFACRTRQLFIRILAVVKWAATAGKVNACEVGTTLKRVKTYYRTLFSRISNISWNAAFDSYVKRQTLWRNWRVKNFSMLGKNETGVKPRHHVLSLCSLV